MLIFHYKKKPNPTKPNQTKRLHHFKSNDTLGEKKIDGNNRRMLRVALNISWKQYSTKQQLYDHLPQISQTIQVRCTSYAC